MFDLLAGIIFMITLAGLMFGVCTGMEALKMLAVLSPSLNRMMVSFSIFVNLVIVNLHTAAHNAIQNSLCLLYTS